MGSENITVTLKCSGCGVTMPGLHRFACPYKPAGEDPRITQTAPAMPECVRELVELTRATIGTYGHRLPTTRNTMLREHIAAVESHYAKEVG